VSDHNPGSELDLDAIEAQARHWDHLIRDDPETTLALVAEVRRLRAALEVIAGEDLDYFGRNRLTDAENAIYVIARDALGRKA
jgi:hypothetical protein